MPYFGRRYVFLPARPLIRHAASRVSLQARPFARRRGRAPCLPAPAGATLEILWRCHVTSRLSLLLRICIGLTPNENTGLRAKSSFLRDIIS